ncbi:MAG TPA: hypothetical protein VF659_11110 [Pyrinomonadaceae bacterium]|jgi:hypothetical protein
MKGTESQRAPRRRPAGGRPPSKRAGAAARALLRLCVACLLLCGALAARADSPPSAVLTCEESPESGSEYLCAVTAQCPPETGCPEYRWSVSAGKVVGDPNAPQVRVDTSHADCESLTVTCKVRWAKLPSLPESVLTKTVKRR